MQQRETEKRFRQGNFDSVAWFYEQASHVYSTGRIRKSKTVQVARMKPGQRVLYLGVGSGEDALRAARRGVNVTCIDLSPRMLDRLERKLTAQGLSAELLNIDAMTHDRDQYYDAVTTNYFLNCFKEPEMRQMLQKAASLVKPGGHLMVADVALPQGNLFSRAFNLAYLKMGMFTFWSMGLIPWHENYDYCRYLQDADLKTEAVEYFRFLKKGPVLFQNIVARKAA